MARVLCWLDDHRNFMQQRLDDVKALVRRIFVAAYGETTKFDIELFGSMKNGVCLPDSDIDLAIVVPVGSGTL
jgi:DNA polymerase sigma